MMSNTGKGSLLGKWVIVVVALIICSAGCEQESSSGSSADSATSDFADTVYKNGRIYTVDTETPWVEAIAIKDGAFVMAGTNDEVEAVTGQETRVVDLGGKFAMPGLHDTHLHLEQAYIAEVVGQKMLSFPAGETDIGRMQQALKEYADNNPDLEVLAAQGLPQDAFPNSSPTKAFIDQVIPDRPVMILSDTEHEGLLNSRLLEMEGITADTPSPKGGEIDREANGEPTGYLRETAAGMWAWKHYPTISSTEHKKGLQAVIAYLHTIGVTSVKQQHAKIPIAQAAQELETEGNLHARIALSWTWRGPLEPMPLDEQEKMILDRKRFASDKIKTEYVKFSLDGNVGTTGYVLEPYLKSGGRGLPVFPELEDLILEVERFDRMGISITAHATGDAANRQLIDAVAAVNSKYGEVKGRHQLAHASLIHPDDYPRLKELDMTAEFSPVVWFPTPYTTAVADELGEERRNRWYPMKSLQDHGARFTLASDGPLMWQDTFSRMEGAVTRKAPDGGEVALAPHEAIDLATALKAMTLDSAYLMDQETTVGSIESGKRADVVVLDRNPFEIPAEEISELKVLLTIFDGEVVFDSANDPSSVEAIERDQGVDLDFSGKNGHPGCESHLTGAESP